MESTETSFSNTDSWDDVGEELMTAVSESTNFEALTTSVHPAPRQLTIEVVYSELERGLFDLYLAVSITVSTFLNVLVLVAILKDSRLYKPENVIIAADAINNLLGVIATQLYMVWALSVDHPHPAPLLCQIHGDFSVAQFSFTGHILCVYAFERSYFLCSPLEYNKVITNLRVIVLLSVLYVFAVLVSHFSAYQGRIFLATMASCQSKTTIMNTAMVFCVFALPSVLMVIYSVRKIKGLESRSVGTATANGDSAKKEKQHARQVSTTKTILLISGAYFMTLLPMGVLRLVVLATGISVLDLETRNCSHAWPILFRIANLIMVSTVNFINPILYLTMRKSLKASLGLNSVKFGPIRRLFGDKRTNKIQPSELPSITYFTNAKQ